MSWLLHFKFGQICKFSALNCELQLCSREKRENQILNNDIDWLSASHPDIRADTAECHTTAPQQSAAMLLAGGDPG